MASVIGKRILLPPAEPLYVVIYSGGGEFRSSVIMKRFLESVPNVQVICRYCGSGAGIVFTDSHVPRLVTLGSEFMMHEMYMDHITAKRIQSGVIVNDLIESSDVFNKMLYSHIGITKEEYEKKILDREWRVRGAEILKLHLADELVKIRCDQIVRMMLPNTCLDQ